MNITRTDARNELTRRALPKNDPEYQNRGPAWQLGGEELRKLAGADLQAKKAQAKKALAPKAPKGPKVTKHGRTKDGRPVSQVAWELRGALAAQGIKRTYDHCVQAVKAAQI